MYNFSVKPIYSNQVIATNTDLPTHHYYALIEKNLNIFLHINNVILIYFGKKILNYYFSLFPNVNPCNPHINHLHTH